MVEPGRVSASGGKAASLYNPARWLAPAQPADTLRTLAEPPCALHSARTHTTIYI